MGDLSKDFNRSEFGCKGKACKKLGCRDIAVDYELLKILEDIRTTFDQPVTITSAYRCTMHNAAVKGSRKSMHLTGKAADIQVKNVSPQDIQKYLRNQYKGKYGIGSYDTFTHIDTRDTEARWNG